MFGASRCRAISILAAVGLVLAACANAGKETTQTVRVETPDCAPASCELSNDRGHWRVSPTPGSVAVTVTHQPLEVRCSVEGGWHGRRLSYSSMGATTGAGAIAGGVAGGTVVGATLGAAALAFIPPLGVIAVVTGVATGAATGQAIESGQRVLRYPDMITVPMYCGSTPAAVGPAGGAVGLGILGLLPPAAREAGVGERNAVLVTSVRPDGVAAAAGLRIGDVIVAADSQDLVDAADLEERLRALPPGTSLELRVWRDRQWLALRLSRVAMAP